MEDDAAVREMVRQTLAGSGYAVHALADPAEAIDLVAAGGAPFDLLVTDVIMPKMSGAQLAARLAAEERDIPVLYISGYPEGWLTDRGALVEGIELLEKPFVPERLLGRVRAVLDREAGRA